LDLEPWLKPAALLFFLAASAFFSSVEGAYFSLSRSALERLEASVDPRARRVARLMSNPRLLLSAILAGNTVANTAMAAVSAVWALEIAESAGISKTLVVTIEVVVVTIVVLYFAELIPKLQALRSPEAWALNASLPVELSVWLFFPLAWPLAKLAGGLGRLFGVDQHPPMGMSEEEIRALVEVGHEHGALELQERQMIHSIFELGDTIVREVMVPRIDMVAVSKEASLDEILDKISKHGHSRIPVYDEKIDNIVGIVHVKELLAASRKSGEFSLMKHTRKAYFVPGEKKIDDLLKEFQVERVHMAIVLDEHGGTDGLVTLEDIIEEIVGEIQDEYDEEQPLFTRLDERTLVANGKMSIYDLNDEVGHELVEESEAYDTIGGFVHRQLGSLPRKGDKFDHNGYGFSVEEMIGRRITRLKVEKGETLFEDD
jgi:putative hemolysin